MSKRKTSAEERAPFTRDEMAFETRRAALALASILSNFGPGMAADELAAKYLGVELEIYDFDRVLDEELARIPVERHFLYQVVMDAYDYAYQVGSRGLDDGTNVDERAHQVAAVLTGFPQTDFNGEPSPLNRLGPQKLRQVLETSMARYNLDSGGNLTVRDLALLANMGEAAVRTSLSAEGIRTMAMGKGLGVVPNGDATAWLIGRRGFAPSARYDGVLDPGSSMHSIFGATNLDFVSALQKAIAIAGSNTAELAARADVSEQWLGQLAAPGEEAEVDLLALERLAKALSAPHPLFVGKAVTDLLSRRRPAAAICQ